MNHLDLVKLALVTAITAALPQMGWAAAPAGSAEVAQADTQAASQADTPAGASKKASKAELKNVTALQTVVVTATKRAQSVDDIPATVNVLDGTELEQHNVQTLSDIASLTPGVNVTTPPGNSSRVTIRGVSSEANTNPTTGILYGDTSLTSAYVPQYTPDPYPFDMQDVEVLKGPQGTLFGAAALNGAIRYVPTPPEFGVLSGKYYVQYTKIPGSGDAFGAGAAVNLPLDKSNQMALRVTAYDNQQVGYINNVRTNDPNSNRGRVKGARAILAWAPTDALNISLSYANQRGHFNDLPYTSSRGGELSAYDRPRSSPYNQNFNVTSLKVDYDFGPFNLISESSSVRSRYSAFREGTPVVLIGGAQPVVGANATNDANSWSQEFRLTSHEDATARWRWTAGVFASRQNIKLTDDTFLGDPSVPALTTATTLNGIIPGLGSGWYFLGQPDYQDIASNVTVREVAAFFDVTRKLGDDWELSLGGRLYKTQSGGQVGNQGLLPYISGYPSGLLVDETVKQSGFSPKVSLLWHATDTINFYAVANKGYRVGGPQWGVPGLAALTIVPTTFKTDTIWNYELGMRSRWLDNKLSWNTSVFYENWKNPQVFLGDGTGSSYIGNVGEVVSKGAETSVQYLVPQLPGLSIKFAGTYNHATIQEPLVTVFASVPPIPVGTPWPLSPKWQTATVVGYEHSIGDWYIGGYLSNTYVSKTKYGLLQPDNVYGFSTWNAQIRLGRFNLPTSPELSLSVENLTDKRGVINSFSGNQPAAFWQTVTHMQPRTFMLRLSGTF